jgi:hypothetical protein
LEKVYNEAAKVAAEGGVVYVDGPDGVAVAITPEAAFETSARLSAKAAEAQDQETGHSADAIESEDRDLPPG